MNSSAWLASGIVIFVALAGCSRGGDSAERALFEALCSRCHTLEVPLSKGKTLDGWRKSVWVMRQRGAQMTDEEAEKIAKYLAQIRPSG